MSFSARLFGCFRLFVCGICMGAADLVPGISGGTIAFMMGFYEELIESLKTLNIKILKDFIFLRFRNLSKAVAWRFLIPLGGGVASAFVLFASPLNKILGNPTDRAYLYATFFGLVVASFFICIRQLKEWKLKHVIFFLVSAVTAYYLTDSTLGSSHQGLFSMSFLGLDLWLAFCGAISICAMLLPGISGSYLLTILGVYAVVIGSLSDFIQGIKLLQFDTEAFFVLLSLAIGIVAGLLLFVRCISWLLRCYHSLAVATLLGFMIGSIRSIWPFWTYAYITNPSKPQKGAQLQPLAPFMPELDSNLVLESLCFAIGGFFLVIIFETVKKASCNVPVKFAF